ncbi:glycosyltransferase family 2 protein [Pseudooceanicola sp. LIPI14-2-Ac024]|uniref:glycosyltransferase family 2 protein n=1 Tax=Pseudooceanicola sp. LIPI14-2-Ac024 TaxID=3344875 RepID=UPI0035CE9B33
MRHDSLQTFLRSGAAALAPGPVAMIFAEDAVELASTIRHHRAAGFAPILVFMAPYLDLPEAVTDACIRIDCDLTGDGAMVDAVNAVIAAAPGTWMYYCYNAEYLFHPFCETRTVREMLAFHAEERRDAMLTYVVDLYAGDLDAAADAVSLEDAHLDRTGYYALAREGEATDRQLDFFGGLRWRFEEHVPPSRRRIDRIGLFRAKPGLRLRDGHVFNDPEYNTYACPWHHNLTAAICSFRTAKALRVNPGSREHIRSFKWHNSAPFEWHSRQLLDLGLMEPGQWF